MRSLCPCITDVRTSILTDYIRRAIFHQIVRMFLDIILTVSEIHENG